MKQTEVLGNGGNALPHQHMDMLHLALLPTLALSLPGMKYGLAAAHRTPTVTAETMPGQGKSCNR